MVRIKECLREKLEAIPCYGVTCLCAPIGYGKTTVMRYITEQKAVQVEWYDAKGPRWEPKTYYDQETWVILEDYQEIEDHKAYSKMIYEVSKESRERLHIVILTRREVSIVLGELIIKKHCQVIDKQDLAYDEEQIQEYLLMHSDAFTQEKTRLIWEYTRGWPAMVELIKRMKQEYHDANNQKILFDFIEEEIYNTRDEKRQKLLLFLGAIGQFRMREFEDHQAYQMIRTEVEVMLRDNIPYVYDRSRRTYELIPVIRAYSQYKLQLLEPESMREISRLAGEVYRQRGDWNSAIKYFRQGGWQELIIQCLASDESNKLGKIDYALLASLFDELEEQVKDTYPLVYLRLLYCKFIESKYTESIDLTPLENYYRALEGLEETKRTEIMGEIYAIKVMLEGPCHLKTNDNLQKANEYLPEGSSIVHTMDWLKRDGLCLSYEYHLELGKYEEEVEELLYRLKDKSFFGSTRNTEVRYLFLAEHYTYRGEWDKATIKAKKLFIKGELVDDLFMRFYGQVLLARIALAKGDKERGRQYIQGIKNYAPYRHGARLSRYVSRGIEWLTYYLGEPIDEEALYSQEVIGPIHKELEIDMYVGKVARYIQKGEYIILEIIGDGIQEGINQHKAPKIFAVIYAQLYLAIAKEHTMQREAAKAHLIKALEMSYPDHIILPFIEHGRYIDELLRLIAKEKHLEGYIQEILGEQGEAYPCIPAQQYAKWRISPREQQIIELTKAGMTNKEIAAELCIAHITVAKTLSNIYRKVGASNKAEMVNILNGE